jgi:hypothetical protein
MANCGERSGHDPARIGYGQQIVNSSSRVLERWSTCQLVSCGLAEIKYFQGMREIRTP